MKKGLLLISGLILVAGLMAQKTPKTTKSKPVQTNASAMVFKNLVDSFSYAAGLNVARNMKEQGISTLNTALMSRAIQEVFSNKAATFSDDAVNSCIQRQMEIFSKEKLEEERARGIAFLEANKRNPGVFTLPSGLQYKIIKMGDSTTHRPKLEDTVVVNYIGSFVDGREFENSVKRGQPAVFALKGVISGWTEILQMMPVGSHWKVFIPSELGYGAAGNGSIPPNAALVFEIMLEGIKPAGGKANN